MVRFGIGVAGALLLVALSLPAAARGGGTLVIAPEDLSESDCRPGAPTRFEGFDAGAFALGCVYPRANRGVLLAGDLGGSFACFYIVPAGSSNEGPCAQVGQKHRKEPSSPLTGLRGLVPLTVGRYGEDLYLAGWASDDVPRVTTEFSARSGESIEREAELLRVPASQQEALGASTPFSIFVARIPDDVDTCGGIAVSAPSSFGTQYRERFSRWNRAYPAEPVPLPGTRPCDIPTTAPSVMTLLESLFATLTGLPTAIPAIVSAPLR
jgi:hypothetical protein